LFEVDVLLGTLIRNGTSNMRHSSASRLDLAPNASPAAIAAALIGLYALVALPAAAAVHPAEIVGWLPIAAILAAALIALSAIDAHSFQLPDRLTLPLASAGVLLHAPQGMLQMFQAGCAALGAYALMACIAAAYGAWRGRAGIGLGDAKLMSAAGSWLGFAALPTVVALASSAALFCVAVAAIRQGGVAMQTRLPFGPFLALAFWLVWLYGPIDLGNP